MAWSGLLVLGICTVGWMVVFRVPVERVYLFRLSAMFVCVYFQESF